MSFRVHLKSRLNNGDTDSGKTFNIGNEVISNLKSENQMNRHTDGGNDESLGAKMKRWQALINRTTNHASNTFVADSKPFDNNTNKTTERENINHNNILSYDAQYSQGLTEITSSPPSLTPSFLLYKSSLSTPTQTSMQPSSPPSSSTSSLKQRFEAITQRRQQNLSRLSKLYGKNDDDDDMDFWDSVSGCGANVDGGDDVDDTMKEDFNKTENFKQNFNKISINDQGYSEKISLKLTKNHSDMKALKHLNSNRNDIHPDIIPKTYPKTQNLFQDNMEDISILKDIDHNVQPLKQKSLDIHDTINNNEINDGNVVTTNNKNKSEVLFDQRKINFNSNSYENHGANNSYQRESEKCDSEKANDSNNSGRSYDNNFEMSNEKYIANNYNNTFDKMSLKKAKMPPNGLLGKISSKIFGGNGKKSKDQKILEIMMKKREEKEKEAQLKKEAYRKWEEEKLEKQYKSNNWFSSLNKKLDQSLYLSRNNNSSTPRTDEISEDNRRSKTKINNFSRSYSLGGYNKEKSPFKEKAEERRRLVKQRQSEQQQQHDQYVNQLQQKQQEDFQRVNSLRSSKSQQNLLKSRLKSLSPEQNQNTQHRKSMENLKKSTKDMRSVTSTSPPKQSPSSQETCKKYDVKAKQSKLRLKAMEKEMKEYQEELNNFNLKQQQQAEWLAREMLLQRKEEVNKMRTEKMRMHQENLNRIQMEKERRQEELQRNLSNKEMKSDMIIKQKQQAIARSRQNARASQELREKIRRGDLIGLAANSNINIDNINLYYNDKSFINDTFNDIQRRNISHSRSKSAHCG